MPAKNTIKVLIGGKIIQLFHVLVKMASQFSAILHLKWDYYLEHSQETTNQ